MREPSRLGMPPATTLNTSIPGDTHTNAETAGTGNPTDVVVPETTPASESDDVKHAVEHFEVVVPPIGKAESPQQSTSANTANTQVTRKDTSEGEIVEDVMQTKQFMSRRDVETMGEHGSDRSNSAPPGCLEAESISATTEENVSGRGAEDLSAGVATQVLHEADAQLGSALPSATENIRDGTSSIPAVDQDPTESVSTVGVPEAQVQAQVHREPGESQPIASDPATELTGAEATGAGGLLHGATARQDETGGIPDKKSCVAAASPGNSPNNSHESFEPPPVQETSVRAAGPTEQERPEQGSPPIAKQAPTLHMEESASSNTHDPAPVRMDAEIPTQVTRPTVPMDELASAPFEQKPSRGDMSSRSSLGESPDLAFEVQATGSSEAARETIHPTAGVHVSGRREEVQQVGREERREPAPSPLPTSSATPAPATDAVELNPRTHTHMEHKPEAQTQAQQHGVVCKVGTERGGVHARSVCAEARFARGGGAASSSSSKALARAPRQAKRSFQPSPQRRAPGPPAAPRTEREPFRNTPFPIEGRARLGPPPMWPPNSAPNGGWFPPSKQKGAPGRLSEQYSGDDSSPRHSDHSRSSGHRSLPDLDASSDVLPPINAPLHVPVLAVPQHQR